MSPEETTSTLATSATVRAPSIVGGCLSRNCVTVAYVVIAMAVQMPERESCQAKPQWGVAMAHEPQRYLC